MRIARSNRFNLNPKEKKALARMARDGILIDDMEEGEISDTSSVEEISEEDFKQDVRVSKPSSGDARIWMGDMYKYPVSSTYASGLYNLAWAQAVQNKSLDEILVRDFGLDAEKSKRSSSKLLANCREDNNKTLSPSKEDCKEIIDISGEEIDSKMGDNVIGDEKEEGELEEGEIDLDSEMIEEPQEGIANDNLPTIASEIDSNPSEMDVNESEFDGQIKLIREKLGTVTVEDAEKSFHSVCSQLQKSLESFNLSVMKNRFLSIDFLIQPLFTAIQIIISVFRSMDRYQQEKNGDILLRLLALVKNQDPAAFSSEQMRQIEAVLSSLDAEALLSSTKNMKKEGSRLGSGVNLNKSGALVENPAHDFSPSKKPHLEPLFVNLSDLNDENMGSEASNLRMSFGSKGKVHFGPILDLHRDHDADSLPSPTREAPMPLSVQKSLDVEDKAVRPSLTVTAIVEKPEDKTMHPYETDALKAVSTYQQKFGWTPYFSSNKLPSPTPSEECNDGDGDSDEEFSSHSTVSDIRTTNSPIPSQSTCSDTQNVDSLKAQGLVPAKNVGQIGSVPNHVLKASAKSRDPRLRFANTEVATVDLSQRPQFVDSNPPKTDPLGGNSRKHKILEESLLDDHKLKKQRNGLTNSGISMDVQKVSGTGTGGFLEDNGKAVSQFMERNHLVGNRGADAGTLENGRAISGKRQEIGNGTGNINVTVDGIKQLPVDDPGNKISLPSLLKDIAVNPTMLMNLIKMEQQRLATEAQKKSGDPAQNMSHPSSLNAISGTVPFANSLSSNTLELQQKPIGKPQASSQIDSMKQQGDLGNIRMKPRDPRRVLHNGTFQKSNYLRSGQSKTNGAPSLITQGSKDNLVVRQQGEQAEINPMPSQSTTLPDISGQFTKGLKNLADMLSASQTTNAFPVPLDDSTQPILLKTDKADAKVVAKDLTDQQSGTGLMPEEGAGNPCPSQNVWGDLEHLFEGYDDQQKAAIQRERARRMEEQSKMFAARKLCLVLDLDHTLLNSAKFVEVDAVHEEILRKKEEQDREKPERHLFRFSHMGMWTKLRPGIWNFLEKASKLYELHLYTMGNKLYATEMAKVLDPTGMLFAGRVISKGDDGDLFDGDDRVPKSKDLDGVLGMESDVVIIDDSVRVWPHNKLNLIVVERYTYFPCSRRQFGLLGPSLLEIDHDERPEDGTLASALSVIERIHQNFFSNRSLEDVDVRNILASEQRKILAGCRIVFSRVFPVGEANPQLHPLWQTAEQFGAVCTNQIDEHVTHVVANSLGTDKVNWALTTGRFVVHPGWVEASALLYRKANEHDFAVKL